MRLMLILGVFVMLIAAACGGDGGDTEDPTTGREALEARENDLRESTESAVNAFLDGDADEFYSYFSSGFRERCELQDFRAILAVATIFMGDLSERERNVEVTEVRFEEDKAFVSMKVDIEGMDFDDGTDEGSFSDFWVLEDGEWKADTTDETPCDLGEGIFGDTETELDTDDDDDAPTGPGTSRGEAVGRDESVTSGDLRVTVLDVNLDAADALLALNEFMDPPAAGNRYVLISVRTEHIGDGEETISVSGSDYELTGTSNVVYDTFEQETRCGFFDGEISGEMFPGGVIEGDVCFQVPEAESGLILIVQPFFSFEDDDRRFIRLE